MRQSRKERHRSLKERLKEDPFLTDKQLAEELQVSVATIRLDRMALDIPELRARAKNIASSVYSQLRALQGEEVIGELIDLELGKRGTSVLVVTEQMVFERNQILRGHFLFAQGNSLAVAIVNSDLALTKNSTVRFVKPVRAGDRVVAEAATSTVKGSHYTIQVTSRVQDEIVFQGEYVVVDVGKKKGAE